MMSGGGGAAGGVKKCFLGLRRTALLSAEGKKLIPKSWHTLKPRYILGPGTRKMSLVANERGRMGVLCGKTLN
jgi:hypothetical protein